MESFIRRVLRHIWRKVYSVRSSYYLNRIEKKKKIGSIIKVGFLVQMPEIWDKQESLYLSMVEDPRFDPWMIIIPAYDIQNKRIENYGKELAFFKRNNINERYIIAFDEGKWHRLEDDGFDYIFYQRPYNNYLPVKYKSSWVMKYSKTCYVPYGSSVTNNFLNVNFPADFINNLYFGFVTDSYECEYYNRLCHHKRKPCIAVGSPQLESVVKKRVKYNGDYVLWTPRWTYDDETGGSHFLEYNSLLTNYEWGPHKLIVRPHPLMWDNFIREHLISCNDKENIMKNWIEKGVIFDSNDRIEDTFFETEILISDISTIIPVYFLSGQPIIYCPSKKKPTPLFGKLLPGIYQAESWAELEMILSRLLNGEDPLLAKRKRIIKEIAEEHYDAISRILSALVNDFMRGISE